MKKYFTSLDLEDGKFIGSLHDPDSNKVIYKTKGYNSQHQVTSDINEYLTKLKNSETKVTPHQPHTIVNTINYQSVATKGGRCCGRG